MGYIVFYLMAIVTLKIWVLSVKKEENERGEIVSELCRP